MSPEQAGESSDDLRATLEAAFAVPEAVPDSVVPDVDAADPDIVPAADATPSPASAAPIADHPTDPNRYADGKFKPTKTEAAPAAPETVSPSVDTQTKASVPASTPDNAPPAGWTAVEKAEWSKLPPAIQAAVSRREAEMTRGGQQWSEQKRHYEQTLSPLIAETQRLGIAPQEGLNHLLAAHHALNRDPANAIKALAQQYGLDLATLAGQPNEAPQGQDISALVDRHVNARLAPIQERLSAEDRRQQQQTVDTVTEFATSPGHEHFDAVQAELMAMIPQIRGMNPSWPHAKVLQEAYDRAVFANPTTRQSTLAARDAEAEKTRQAAATERARKARLAASSVTGSPSGAPAAIVPDSIRGALEQAWAGSA